MRKILFAASMLATAFVAPAAAQQKIYLNKGNNTVETVVLGENDYVAFGRPEGVREQRLAELTNVKAGKNYVKYTVVTKTPEQPYYQMCVSESYLRLFVMKYFSGASLSEMTDEELHNVLSTLMLMGSYGYGMIGGADFTMTDGEKPDRGSTQFIAAGENYYVVVCDLVENDGSYSLGNDLSYTKVRTADAGESKATLSVEYKGVDADGKQIFDVTPGSGINSLHLVFATTHSIDEFVNLYGYASLMYEQGINFSAEQWEKYSSEYRTWNIEKESDYSFLALGVDENGDWVKASVENLHIKPLVTNDCPEVDVTNLQCVDGQLAIEYTIKSKATAIQSARMLIMKENDWDNALNAIVRDKGYEKPSMAWADYMASTDKATDVTDAVKALGNKLTFKRSFTADERGWYVIVLAVTDEYGTTVTRSSFHTHLDNAEWDTLSKTFPN